MNMFPHKMLLPIIVGLIAGALHASDVLEPASTRFAKTSCTETPDFQRHVVPLIGRLGCNGRACHGSFQGQGGLRLSLFGYDFQMDHDALTGDASSQNGTRINRAHADQSLIVRKPSMGVDHDGGQRFGLGSWEHRLLLRWIAEGAAGVDSPHEIAALDIHPNEIVFDDRSPPIQLRVIARWHDGGIEDVTPLCRFRSNDDSVAAVDANGLLHSTSAGDTHIVAFYDNGVATTSVLRPVSKLDKPELPSVPSSSRIDQFVIAKLQKLGIVPSPLCSDAEFLRRLSIDLTGTLPIPAEVEAFVADETAGKRQRKINELLERPSYAAWWANKFCDFTGCNPNQQAELGQETSVQWYTWVYQRLKENTPYDELIARIVLARGRDEGQSYDDYASQTTAYFQSNSPAAFAARETMPHYWSRTTMEKADDKALAFAHNFLGVRLQCAQCHKHPFAPWTQDDFLQFSKILSNITFGVPDDAVQRYQELAKNVGLRLRNNKPSPVLKATLNNSGMSTLPWRELHIASRDESENLTLLRSKTLSVGKTDDPRKDVMQWMKEPNNPWFAQALVNRVWAGYFHTGIVNPPDDINPANPPSHPGLLKWLSKSFVENDYDIKWLHREIVSSHTYQRSWKPNETNREDRRNFSHAIPRRIPAEIVYDGLKQALAGSNQLAEVRSDLSRRAIGHLSMRLAGTYAMHVFGKPERAVNCDCERSNQPTLLQSVFMQNDPLVAQRIDESAWIGEIEEAESLDQKLNGIELVQNAWLRTLGRPPSTRELEVADRHLSSVGSAAEGMRDLMWALVNTKEFILNR